MAILCDCVKQEGYQHSHEATGGAIQLTFGLNCEKGNSCCAPFCDLSHNLVTSLFSSEPFEREEVTLRPLKIVVSQEAKNLMSWHLFFRVGATLQASTL